MEPVDLTVEILREIRDGVNETNSRLDETNSRLDETNSRLDRTTERIDAVRSELSERIVHSEIRTATALTELAGSVREMTGVLRTSAELRPRVERCEHEIAEIKQRLDRPTT